MKKGILLLLALALPALVFVFLKRFGKNEFVVPVFHAEVPEWTLHDCPTAAAPLRYKSEQTEDGIRIVTTQSLDTIEFDLRRVEQNIDRNLYRIVAVARDSVRCALLLRDNESDVLIDSAGQIRGYYRIGSREETDRLILELKILLKQY